METFLNIIPRIHYKDTIKLALPTIAIFASIAVLFSHLTMPGHSFFMSVIIGLSITAGTLLYAGGLITSIFAIKKAHDLFRQDDGLRESVTA